MSIIHRGAIRFLFVAVVAAFPASLAAQNFVTPTIAQTPGVSPSGLTTGQFTIANNAAGSRYTDPHVSSDLVCYSTSDNNGGFTVHYFNLVTGIDSQIPNPDTTQYQDFECDVRGLVIAFTRASMTTDQIMTLDTSVSGAQPVQISPTTALAQESSIGDATIVWRQQPTSLTGWDILAYDRAGGTVQQIDPPSIAGLLNQTANISPDGTVAVWSSCPTKFSNCSVWKATLTNGTWTAQALQSAIGGDQSHPDTDGTTIAYNSGFDLNNAFTERVLWQTVAGGTEQVLSASSADYGTNPSISNAFIALDLSATLGVQADLAVYDIARNTLYDVTSDLAAAGLISSGYNAQLADISVTPDGKARVAWQDGQGDAVYAYTFYVGSNLAIQKTAAATAMLGSNLIYTITVSNSGPQAATSVTVTDPLPAGTTLVNCTPPSGATCSGTSPVTVNLGSLAVGASATATLTVTTPSTGAGTVLSNTATVTAAGLDINPVNSATATTTLSAYNICTLYDPTHAVKSGAVIPIQFELCNSSGADISSSSIVVTATSVVQVSTQTSDTVEDAGNSNPDNNFRFSSTLGSSGGYIFNLSTAGLTTGTYNLNFTVGNSPQTYSVPFQVK